MVQVMGYSLGAAFAIDSGRNDSSGITGSLSAREQAFHGEVLQGILVTYDAYRRGSAGFYRNHDGFVG